MRSNSRKSARAGSGFTLLEVIVALTITGFVLGSLFTLVAGSKQLSWRSQQSLVRAINARAQINYSLLENEYIDVEPVPGKHAFRVATGGRIGSAGAADSANGLRITGVRCHRD